jgi:hypothetical protein
LLSCTSNETKISFEFTNPVVSQLVFENVDKVKSFRFTDKNGLELAYTKSFIGNKIILEVETTGDFNLDVFNP